MELRQRRAGTADYRWVSITRSVIRDGDGRPRLVIAQFTDVHDRRTAEDVAQRLALTDPLTGLSNRRHFLDRLAHAHDRLQRAQAPLAVMFVDLDHFKAVNDELGHDAGDALLEEVAAAIGSSVRPGDTVARLGGDEFAVIVEDVAVADLRGIAERLCRRLELRRDLPDGRFVRVTASIGIAVTEPPGRTSPTDVLRRADEAMYCAKQLGRARWVVLDEPPAAPPVRRAG
jgi:diguanylate cyclase (GGDEF)-like protein